MGVNGCLFCGGNAASPEHFRYCNGRQGAREAEELPLLISGLEPETYDTSAAAALSVEDAKDTQRRQVYAAIRAAGQEGATDDELQERLQLDGSSERPRRWELWKLNQITLRRDDRGAVVTRPTRTHRRAVVWVAA